MSLTRADVCSRVRAYINEPSERFVSTADISRWVDDSMKDISIRTFCNTIVATSMTCTAGCASYSWPNSLNTTTIITLGIKTILNSSNVALDYVPMDLFGRAGLETYSNEMKWSTWHQQIYFTPTPTSNYTFKPILWIVGNNITADTATLSIPEQYHHVAVYYCTAMALEKRRNYELASVHWMRYEALLDRILQSLTAYDAWIDGKQRIRDQSPAG